MSMMQVASRLLALGVCWPLTRMQAAAGARAQPDEDAWARLALHCMLHLWLLLLLLELPNA